MHRGKDFAVSIARYRTIHPEGASAFRLGRLCSHLSHYCVRALPATLLRVSAYVPTFLTQSKPWVRLPDAALPSYDILTVLAIYFILSTATERNGAAMQVLIEIFGASTNPAYVERVEGRIRALLSHDNIPHDNIDIFVPAGTTHQLRRTEHAVHMNDEGGLVPTTVPSNILLRVSVPTMYQGRHQLIRALTRGFNVIEIGSDFTPHQVPQQAVA